MARILTLEDVPTGVRIEWHGGTSFNVYYNGEEIDAFSFAAISSVNDEHEREVLALGLMRERLAWYATPVPL